MLSIFVLNVDCQYLLNCYIEWFRMIIHKLHVYILNNKKNAYPCYPHINYLKVAFDRVLVR